MPIEADKNKEIIDKLLIKENPSHTELQGMSNKKRKKNERETALHYVSKKGTQAKVRKLLVSELREDNDLPQSNLVTKSNKQGIDFVFFC